MTRAKALPAAIKNCLECGTPFRCTGFRVAPGPMERKFCGEVCMRAYKRFAPRHGDRQFWPKVDKSGGPDACWPYYRLDPLGYGRFAKAGPYAFAHRAAWQLANGAIPAGLDVLHRCDNRSCCNPAHLRLGTHQDNMDDCKARGRTNNGCAKLTVEQVRYIKANYRKTGPRSGNGSELARRFGVKPGTVHAIGRGDAWARLDRHSGDEHS